MKPTRLLPLIPSTCEGAQRDSILEAESLCVDLRSTEGRPANQCVEGARPWVGCSASAFETLKCCKVEPMITGTTPAQMPRMAAMASGASCIAVPFKTSWCLSGINLWSSSKSAMRAL